MWWNFHIHHQRVGIAKTSQDEFLSFNNFSLCCLHITFIKSLVRMCTRSHGTHKRCWQHTLLVLPVWFKLQLWIFYCDCVFIEICRPFNVSWHIVFVMKLNKSAGCLITNSIVCMRKKNCQIVGSGPINECSNSLKWNEFVNNSVCLLY